MQIKCRMVLNQLRRTNRRIYRNWGQENDLKVTNCNSFIVRRRKRKKNDRRVGSISILLSLLQTRRRRTGSSVFNNYYSFYVAPNVSTSGVHTKELRNYVVSSPRHASPWITEWLRSSDLRHWSMLRMMRHSKQLEDHVFG